MLSLEERKFLFQDLDAGGDEKTSVKVERLIELRSDALLVAGTDVVSPLRAESVDPRAGDVGNHAVVAFAAQIVR